MEPTEYENRVRFAKLVVGLDDAIKHRDGLKRQFNNVLFPKANELVVVHSFARDGGDASQKGTFSLFLKEQEIRDLMEARLADAEGQIATLEAEVNRSALKPTP